MARFLLGFEPRGNRIWWVQGTRERQKEASKAWGRAWRWGAIPCSGEEHRSNLLQEEIRIPQGMKSKGISG